MKPVIYQYQQHLINIESIDSDALYVISTLQHYGYTAYLVGGSIRDLLLGKQPKDFDVSTSAKPEEIKKIFRSALLIGKRFRLAHVRFNKKVIEVSTFRSGDTQEDNLITVDNTWGTAEQDAMRRDFRLNGLFYDPTDQVIIDYVGGFEDIQKKRLHAIGDPFIRFRQDPVRMIRLLKFQARFHFSVDENTHIALLENRHEILKSSQARIFEELLKMLESSSSRRFIQLMAEVGLLEPLLPELSHFLEKDQTHRVFTFLDELDGLITKYPDLTIERSVLLAALVFPYMDHKIRELDQKQKMHLGLIQQEIALRLDHLFLPFFHVPRKMKTVIASLLGLQYRFTPLQGGKPKHFRLPFTENVIGGLKILNLRTRLDSNLKPLWKEWKKLADQIDDNPKPKKPKKRWFRRRR